MNFRLISILVALLAVVEVVVSTSVKDLLSGFTQFFYNLSYEKKQDIVMEAVQELQNVFPQGVETISLPESADIETCKVTLQKAVKQNHEWYLLAMGQFTQLKFFNNFLNDKVSRDLQEEIDKAAMSAGGKSGPSDSIIIGNVLYDAQQLSQILDDAQALREENVQLRNALSSVRADLEKSSTTVEELKLEVQSSLQEANRAKADVYKFEKKLAICRRSEYNLKKIVYELKRGKFSKFKSAIFRPFRNMKLKKALGKEGLKAYKQKKQADSKKRREIIKKVKREIKQSKSERRNKILNKSANPGDDTPIPLEESMSPEFSFKTDLGGGSSQHLEEGSQGSPSASISGVENTKSESSNSGSIFETSN